MTARAEIIPLVTKDDEAFLLYEDSIPEDMPMLPLRDNVLFPGVVMPITIGRKSSLKLVKAAERQNQSIVCVTQCNNTDEPTIDDIFNIGVVGRVLRVIELPQNQTMAVIQGTMKCSVECITETAPFMRCKAVLVDENFKPEHPRMFHNQVTEIRKLYSQLQEDKSNGQGPKSQDVMSSLRNIGSDRILVNYIALHLDISTADKQLILDAVGYEARAEMVLDFLKKELDYVHLRDQVQDKARQEMDRQQREYFLNQQMRVIQDELGGSPADQDIQRLLERASKMKWPAAAKEAFDKTIEKLKRTPVQTPDYSVEINYAELMLDLPWNDMSKDNLDLKHAQKVLDEDHFGLDKVKDRIMEYLAVLKLKGNMKSPILCLYGPPGVGKTSLGKSIARALGRKYVRIALGGMHDEAEIRGHRKTYVGALPGRILNGIARCGTSNPVIVLDEIDKLSSDFKGDPSSALLEALDPEQNGTFHDNYLDIDYDLSNVLFLTTANGIGSIQPALLDRMEVINVSGYLAEEKMEIARKYLIPKQLEEHGMSKSDLRISAAALKEIIDSYTHESGVRTLEKQIAKIARVTAKKIALGEKWPATIEKEHLKEYLGLPTNFHDLQKGNEVPGVVTGLAWTQMGGEILFIESSVSGGKGVLSMTGNLGDVMKESAQIAYQYIKAHPEMAGLTSKQFSTKDIHVHVPEGATPKDGPSAGITMVTSMVSALRGKAIRKHVAMTGEMTLRGRVLPVGGIKEKILAAKRAGVKTIVISEDNRKDVEDIAAVYVKGLDFHYVKSIADVIDFVF